MDALDPPPALGEAETAAALVWAKRRSEDMGGQLGARHGRGGEERVRKTEAQRATANAPVARHTRA